MKYHNRIIFLGIFLSLFLCLSAYSQKVTGVVKDAITGDLLFGTTIVEKGTTNGTITDFNGRFEISVDLSSSKVLIISFLGYSSQEITVSKNKKFLNVKMTEDAVLAEEVVISASRLNKKLQESPVTVERLGVQGIKETASASFYDGLANLKGVDFTSASLAFKVINTRGFNSTAPVRTLQVIDGMDNQAPALNFSLGNFVGASEIDVERVDIVVGANSATYGPNAFNGVIDIQTKDPFKYPGLNVQVKGATRNLFDGAIRYAKVIDDRFAFKVNLSYLRADDWIADNYSATEESLNEVNLAAGYDAVNTYGDEVRTVASPLFVPSLKGDTARGIPDSTFSVYRSGYNEIDLADYNTRNLKTNASIYYKVAPDVTASYFYNFGTGTTVYQGENRISINGIKFQQHKVELKGENFFVRSYKTLEDAGDSYDIVFTANKLLTDAKPYGQWNNDFLREIRRYSSSTPAPDRRSSDYSTWLDSGINIARIFADNSTVGGYKERYTPGTARFDSAFSAITSNPSFGGGGTRFQDKSSLTHIQGEYNFKLFEQNEALPENFRVGGNYRSYDPNSFGTVFNDTLITDPTRADSGSFDEIDVYEFGFYVTTDKYYFDESLKLIASARYDFHKNFDPAFSPAASAVIKLSESDNIRLTFNSAIRNPTLLDQFQKYDLGRVLLLGNINGINLIPVEDFVNEYIGKGTNPDSIEIHVDAIKPEKVKTFEIGYKGILFSKIYVDASYYKSWYRDFIGNFIGVVNPRDNNRAFPFEVRRVPKNSTGLVTTQGFSVGLNYYFLENFSLNGNYTFTELTKADKDDPLIPSYNTPRHKYNFGLGGRNIANKFGFNVSYKWVQGFRFEGSPQFTGGIGSYGLVDAQVNYKWTAYNTTFKLGVSNLFNNKHFEVYGGPTIERLAYLSLNYEL
ncbi:MAG: iron complex outermembrane receptor protein [Sphingobacteriales bacterium]|jgi:iron complex outermembrane receptor protein